MEIVLLFCAPLFLWAFAAAAPAIAAPYVPQTDTQILEHLPFKANDPTMRDIAQLRATLRQDPRNADIAVKLSQRYYELVAQEGEPRYLGYAQAALAPWWELQQPPLDVLILRAALRQFRHDFADALTDLNQAIERTQFPAQAPQLSRAHLLRAMIHIVQARYPQAQADCKALQDAPHDDNTSQLVAIGCEAMLDGLTGKAESAYRTLRSAFNNHPAATKNEKLWASVRLAEIAQRLGKADLAELHFRQGLALGITDIFLLAAYADFLLDRKRPAEVAALLKDKTHSTIRSDTLLLRLVLAERALASPDAKKLEEMLAARYAAAQLRGDTTHQQEEARFMLHIRHDAKAALTLAQKNWALQREPRDARIFLEAAIAAKEPDAALPVLQWLNHSHIEDSYLTGLAEQK